MSDLYRRLSEALGADFCLKYEPLKNHTTFKVGGPCDIMVLPSDKEEVSLIIDICKEEGAPFFVIGNGSNLLVSDSGYRGVIIKLGRRFSGISVNRTEICAEAGATLKEVADAACKAGLGGFAFAHGIPGTLGGAVTMNAGAYGGEMVQVIKEAVILRENGHIETLSKEKLHLGYRTSIIKEEGGIVLSAVISLSEQEREEISAYMAELKARREEKQPLEYASAGSTFKRPLGYFAGKLIMDSGLRGFRVGGASVSEKHCGFIINKGGATAGEILSLIRHVQHEVKQKFGVELETEVRMLGDF